MDRLSDYYLIRSEISKTLLEIYDFRPIMLGQVISGQNGWVIGVNNDFFLYQHALTSLVFARFKI